MITLFENYISQFNKDDSTFREIVGEENYEKIIDKIAGWYYDNYDITFLGSGTFGSAFRINNEEDRVLKITTDKKEAANVSYLVKKNNVKGVAEYYDIHQVDVYFNNKLLIDVYSIIMERLYSISVEEADIFMFLFNNYFKTGNNKNFKYKDISKIFIDCSWKEFQELNPNRIDEFVNLHINNICFKKLNIYDTKILANIYYEDIMDIVYSVLKYDLVLGDIGVDNIRKLENEHIKVIDVGGTTNKTFRTKSDKIRIDI